MFKLMGSISRGVVWTCRLTPTLILVQIMKTVMKEVILSDRNSCQVDMHPCVRTALEFCQLILEHLFEVYFTHCSGLA